MPNAPAGTPTRDLTSLAQRISGAWDVLRGRAFGPGEPMAAQGTIEERDAGPRQFQYPYAINRSITPRRDFGHTPFQQLRSLATNYDVAALCIAARIEQMCGLSLSFVAKDKRHQRDLQENCNEAEAFWASPDKLNDWQTWLSQLLYELFSTDATSVYKRRDLTGGRLYGLDLVDGATIKPLLDDRGRTVAYQQVLYGLPMSNYNRAGTDAPDEELPTFSRRELLYKPRWTRTFTPYGFPPTEWITVRVNTALRKQAFDLGYFTDGNIPAGLASPPDGSIDPDTMRKFEEAFNAALDGDAGRLNRIKFVPWKLDYKEFRQFSYDTKLDRWMLGITCAAYGISPQELGFVEDVNRANGEMQENINERRGLGPLKRWLKSIIDPITTAELGLMGIEAQFGGGESEDQARQATVDKTYWDMGVVSADEVRALRYGDVLDGDAPGSKAPDAPPTPAVVESEMVERVLKYSKQTEQKRKRYDTMRTNSPKHQQRRKARSAVRAAVERGDLKPASQRTCARCDAKATEYHHVSYDKKGGLDVEPICGSCNTRLSHKEPRKAFTKLEKGATEPWQWPERTDRETTAADSIRRAYDAQEKRITAVLKDAGVGGLDGAFWQAEAQQFEQIVLPVFDDTMLAGATAGIERLGVGVGWSNVNVMILKHAREQAAQVAHDETDATQRAVDQLIADWVASGGGDMKHLIERIAKVWPNHRADAAAITTITNVFSEGQRAAWEASGVVKGYRINTASDSHVCVICQRHDREEYSVADRANLPSFHWRCRCDIDPVVKGADEL